MKQLSRRESNTRQSALDMKKKYKVKNTVIDKDLILSAF